MSSNVPDWMKTQRNLTILVAILVAVPIAYGFRVMVSGADFGGSFLLLMTLAVGVPSAYDEYWPKYDRIWDAVIWIVLACIVATTEFIGLYLVGTELGNLSLHFLRQSVRSSLLTSGTSRGSQFGNVSATLAGSICPKLFSGKSACHRNFRTLCVSKSCQDFRARDNAKIQHRVKSSPRYSILLS